MNIIEIAKSYNGREGGEPHRKMIDEYNEIRPAGSYKMSYTDPWCAAFVSVCAHKAGLNAPIAVNTETIRNQMQTTTANPKPGYFVFFDWNGDGVSDHVGIVEWVDKDEIIVLSGNYSDSFSRTVHKLTDKNILCYGILEEATPPRESNPDYYKKPEYKFDFLYPVLDVGEENSFVYVCQALLKERGFDVKIDGEFGEETANAISVFQRFNDLVMTHKCDRHTWPALLEGDYARLKYDMCKELHM